MTEAVTVDSHELFVWNADELLEAVKKTGEVVRRAIEANEFLKGHVDADVVALTQLIQAGKKVATQVKLLGVMGRAYIKETNGTKYIIFKGNQNLRPNLKGTRYLAENAKVRCFVVGSKDIIDDAAKGTKVAVIAFVLIDIAMEATSDHFSLASLGVRISSDVLQAVTSAGAGAAAGVFVASVFGAPVVITFIIVIAVGFAVGVFLTEMDRKYQLTERLRARMMAYEDELKTDLPASRQAAVDAGRKVVTFSTSAGNEIKNEAYKVDRFFASAAAMIKADGADYWYGL